MDNIKQNLYNAMQKVIGDKIVQAESAIASIKSSRSNETKSSAGDKFETAREMMQQEIDRNHMQLGEAKKMEYTLSQVDMKRKCNKVEPGCLVETNNGTYFICVSLGKLDIENNQYYCVSPGAPLSRSLMGKVVDESVSFNGKEYKIIALQ